MLACAYGCMVGMFMLCVVCGGVYVQHIAESLVHCRLRTQHLRIADCEPSPNPIADVPIAHHSMYVIDESSISHPRFGHVPTNAPVWRRPYPWMNVGNLCPGVNKKPPPTKSDVRRKSVKGLCTWSDHAFSALRSARSQVFGGTTSCQVCRNKGPIAPSRPPHSCQLGNTTVPHMPTRALILRPCYSQPGHRLC